MRTRIGTRLLSLFLTAICVIGLIPTSAFAASSESMPSEITLKKSDYFLDTDGSKTYNSPSFDKPLYLHIINMNVGGETKVGFCAEHGKQLGNTLIGKKWGNPEPVTNSFIKMMIGYYYCMTDAKYQTDAYKEKWGGALWTDQNMIRYHNAWIQALCWRALGQGAAIPSDAEGQKVAIAKELMYIANAKNGTSYSDIYTDKYGTTTFYQKGEKVLDNTDCWPDVDVTLYHYIGGNATSPDGKKHYTNDNTQAIMVATPKTPDTPIEDYQIVVKKVDSTNPTKGLAGATFSLTKVGSDDPKYPLTGVTGQDGTYTFRRLEAGTYQVTETEAPEGYQIDNPGPYAVTLPTNGQKTVTVTATDTPITIASGSIRKVDKDRPTMGLAGATIRITGIDNNFTYEGQTVEGGALTDVPWDTMPVGSYVAEEIGAPEGYILPSPHEKKEFYWDKKNEVKLVFENDSKVKVQLLKKDESNNPLPGCLFTVIKNGQTLFSAVTDAAGTITVPNVTEGTYWFVEKDAPEGYVVNSEPVTAYVSAADIQGNKTVTVEATNHRKPGLEIVKIDSVTKEPVANCTFDIRSIDGTYHETLTTDGAGRIFLENMTPGSYEVKETAVPKGYNLNPEKQTVELTAGGTFTVTSGDTQTIVFKDTKPGGLIIEKRDSVTKVPLAGATFKVTTSDGRFVAQDGGATSTNGLYTTDANGQIHIVDLDPDTYVVTEVTAPDGYLMDAPSQTVKIEKNDTQTLTFYDTPLGGLTIVKVDSESGKRLEGAKIEVAKLNGEIVGTYVTDKLGVIQLPDLDDGWYQLTEIKAPKGYLLDSTPQKVEVKKGETKTFEFENTASASMLIHKIDSVTKKGIQGVKFVVYDSSMTPIGEYESDDQGYVHLNKTLEDGKYYVREIVAAEGYILDNKVKSFTVLAGDTAMIEWENTSELGQIQVIKTSEGYSSVNGLPAGTPLSGAIFAVYDKQNNVVDKFQTNENGIGSSKKLPLGIYTVKEVQAPANYGLNPTVFTADIEFAGQVVKLNVTDPVITAGVSIKKTGYAQTMNNNIMRWTVSGVRNDSTTSLQSFYWRDTLPTDAVRLTRLVTGAYSTTQTYKVTFTTNLNSQWRTAYDNLSTAKNYTLDMSSAALGLASNEYVTQFMLSFGIVPAGFHQLTNATVDAQTLYALTNGYKFTNKADVGGLLGGNWVQSIARWTTSIYSHYVPAKPAAPKSPKLPRTGY